MESEEGGALEAERLRLSRKIEAAWRDTVRPADSRIVDLRGAEYDRLRDAFRGTHWTDWSGRPAKQLWAFRDLLPLFTTEALRFYLPAFLLARLRAMEGTGDLADALLHAFREPRRGVPFKRELVEERIAGLNDAQRDALAAYFRFERDAETDPELNVDPKRYDRVVEALTRREGA